MYADLHIHSNNSDGLLPVKEIIEKSLKENIKIIAITDHDTVDGLNAFYTTTNIEVVPGVELTVTNKLHILGYYINPHCKILKDELEKMKYLKATWIVKLVRYLSKEYNITTKQVLEKYSKITLDSICNYLLNSDDCHLSKKQIYDRYFWANIPCIGKMPSLTAKQAISLIKDAGGIAVLAHPSLIWESNEKFLSLLFQLIGYGLDGIEVFHINNVHNKQVLYFKEIAEKNSLLITGGSDFHGTKNKFTNLGDYGLSKSQWNVIKSYIKNK